VRITILGSGTSVGVPAVGNYWGACDPNNPKNRRRRVSVAVETDGKRFLIDTSPDLREQCLDNDIDHIDAVLYTHDHADHTHGIDDLRMIAMRRRQRVPTYADRGTLETLNRRFDYIFISQQGYPAICDGHEITGPFEHEGTRITPFEQDHGNIKTLGYRIGNFAYSTDVVELSDAAFDVLEGVEVWVVTALRREPHPTHAHLEKSLQWIERVKPKRAFLTHMTWEMDYETLCNELPGHIRPAYDGLVIDL
jgi:phosphoribosyl 1,2-cyclic phosphate phosphodiesterase